MNLQSNPADIQFFLKFFKFATLINFAILSVWAILQMAIPDIIYKSQKRFFPISREAFNVAMYSFLGLYKIVITAFFLVPYIVLLIISAS